LDKEIFQFIYNERILRVLFEQRIFKLREIQKEAIQKGLFFSKSFLECAPSGSGKTLIGEVCAIHIIFQQFGKSVYLVPFKALVMEKYYHFKRAYEQFGIRVELSIGDYDVDDSKLEQADIIIKYIKYINCIKEKFFLSTVDFSLNPQDISIIHNE
jgi:replicative superfamily II helicase